MGFVFITRYFTNNYLLFNYLTCCHYNFLETSPKR